ncbi:MAG: outer membrane beta-barrel protein [Saprospiraceae bacterium]|nr:outer membrane beta-barrel protein [Saprospiraceae bacterium]
MKTSFLLIMLAAAVTFSAPLQAQVRINPKVGVNISALDTKIQDITAEARAGWNVGVDVRAGKGLVFFNPGVHYYSFTARLVSDVVDEGQQLKPSEETMIQSVRVPVNLGINITGQGGLIGLHLKGGVTPAYVIGVKERPNYNFDIETLNRFTMGANVGLGVDILFFTVDANYEIGLNEFFKDAAGKNNMLSLNVGIKF